MEFMDFKKGSILTFNNILVLLKEHVIMFILVALD